jgi:hypothetical protein
VVVLSARSPKYPAIYDNESGVRFRQGRARVTVEQAHKLADRPFVDGFLIGEFDDEGRIVNELPAKEWRKTQRREQAQPDVTSQNTDVDEPPVPEPRAPRSN